MPSFSDFTQEGFPDYDATPEELQPPTELQPGYDPENDPFQSFDADIAFQSTSNEEPDPPGAGDSYQGTDPTAFSEQDGTIDEQAAAAPDAQTLGQSDDPEAQEDTGDEAYGDDEDDTSDPAQVDSGEHISAVEEVRYPEQGSDADELTVREPESINPGDYAGPASVLVTDPELFKVVEELLDWQATEWDNFLLELLEGVTDARDRSDARLLRRLDRTLDQQDQAMFDALDYLLDLDDKITNQMANFAFDEFDSVELDGEDNDDLGDGFTTPSLLAEMADIVGGVDQDTFLTEFQWLNAEDI